MKRNILCTAFAIISVSGSVIFAQDECKVLNSSIGVSYKGSCKKGLADGTGEAMGVDRYKGELKKGFRMAKEHIFG